MNSSGSHKDLAAKYVKINRRNKFHPTSNYARPQMQKGHDSQLASNEIAVSSMTLGDANVAFSFALRFKLVWIKTQSLKYYVESLN